MRTMMHAFLLAALLPALAFAEPPKVTIKAPDGTVSAKSLYKFEIQSDAPNARFGKTINGLTAGKDYYPDSSGRAIYVVFPKAGTYTLTAVASKSDEIGEDVLPVIVTGDGGGGDNTPSDELLETLKAAFAKEPAEVTATVNGVSKVCKREVDLMSLRDAYRVLATKVNTATIQTPADIGQLVASVRAEAVGDRLGKIRNTIAGDFAKIISGSEDKKLTDMDRVNAAKAFGRYADALEKIK